MEPAVAGSTTDRTSESSSTDRDGEVDVQVNAQPAGRACNLDNYPRDTAVPADPDLHMPIDGGPQLTETVTR